MFDFLDPGLVRVTGTSVYGGQDRGIGPGGAMDRFSYETGNGLVGNPHDSPGLEIILAPRLKFLNDAWFVLTGAPWQGVTLRGSGVRHIDHGRVCRASRGDILEFGEKRYGFRTYLCYKSVELGDDMDGRIRGEFSAVASWPDTAGRIRVMKGPEWSWLRNPDDFFSQAFTIGPDSNAMGLRLAGAGPRLSLGASRNMISEAVSDGTVQLTPETPVILLRHRQTLGGYPRIFNVITADLDVLAQHRPGERLRFRAVDRDEALAILRQWTLERDAIINNRLRNRS